MFRARERCPSCGKPTDRDDAWCAGCGRRIGQEKLAIEQPGGPAGTVAVVELGGDQGPSSPRSKKPRRDAAILAALVVAVIAALVALGSNPPSPEEAAAPSSTTTSRPRTPSTRLVRPSTTTSTLPPLMLGEPTRQSVVLATTSGSLRVLDLDSGSVSGVSGFSTGGSSDTFARKGGIVYSDTTTQYYYAAPFDGLPVPLARGARVLPAFADDQVWVLSESEEDRQATLVDIEGDTIVAPYALADDAYVMGATRHGLVLGAAGRVYLWDQRSRAVRPLPSGDIRVVGWETLLRYRCDDAMACGYGLLDVASGTERPVPSLSHSADGDPWQFQNAEYSPDGSTIAFLALETSDAAPARLRLGLLDVETLEVSWLTPEDDAGGTETWNGAPAWSPSGEWLFWCDGYLNAWRVGSEKPQRLEYRDTSCMDAVPLS